MAKLLIADNNITNRSSLRLAMQRDGHQIMEAWTGEECLLIAQQQNPDMILLNAQMSGMDGFNCCAELKAIMQHHCPPVIMITEVADQASVDRAFAVGAIDYVTKPIHIAILKQRVRRVLRERQLIHQLAAINQQLAAANRELKYLARIDSLTQIANRRCFDEILVKEWGRLARQQRSLGIILCDVDFFKHYNDLYGHLVGDRCLLDVSKLLQLSILRSADLVARYGGEEFILLLPETDAPGTMHVAERIHSNIRSAAIPHTASQTAKIVTLSIGATCAVPNINEHPKQLLNIADCALYAAKAAGRNQTVMKKPYQSAQHLANKL